MESCSAFCLPGQEDFGITPIEANAAGKPAIVFAGGGALETIRDGETGVFFHTRSVEDVLDAIHRCDRLETLPDIIAASAQRFSQETFRTSLVRVLHHACVSSIAVPAVTA
jgi:glycosyltransferase involved in cell wall biosynthesis